MRVGSREGWVGDKTLPKPNQTDDDGGCGEKKSCVVRAVYMAQVIA